MEDKVKAILLALNNHLVTKEEAEMYIKNMLS